MITFSPAPVTPMDNNGEIAYDIIDIYVRTLERNGISSVFLNGATGEYKTLSIYERKRIAETWLKCSSSNMRIILNITAETIEESRELIIHANEIGVYGIASRIPLDLEKKGLVKIIEYFKKLSNITPETLFYYYHVPFVDQNYTIFEFFESAIEKIPNFKGVKYVMPDLVDYDQCNRKFGDNYEIYYCMDENILGAMIMGVKYSMGTNFNYLLPLYNQIKYSFDIKDFNNALALQRIAIDIIDLVRKTKNPHGSTRYLMEKSGLKCGQARPNEMRLDNETKKMIDRFFSENKILKYLTQFGI